jgi:DNA-binding beta-propeller fold protein YncE
VIENGKTLYVGCYDHTVTPISTATNTPGRPIRVSGGTFTIAFTPDGKTLYAASSTATRNAVTPISTATNRAGKPIFTSRGHFIFGEHIAITP